MRMLAYTYTYAHTYMHAGGGTPEGVYAVFEGHASNHFAYA
jgi:hypothetical protein